VNTVTRMESGSVLNFFGESIIPNTGKNIFNCNIYSGMNLATVNLYLQKVDVKLMRYAQ
jgi:hypothetical protein